MMLTFKWKQYFVSIKTNDIISYNNNVEWRIFVGIKLGKSQASNKAEICMQQNYSYIITK